MLKLFDFKLCPYVRKTRIALLEKGLQWETTWVDLTKGEQKKPEYLAINPVGKVPALIDDTVVVHDSTIINEYLEDKFPKPALLPADPAMRARARFFEDYADSYLAPSLFKILINLRQPEAERDQEKITEGERELHDHFAFLDRELRGRQFFAGMLSLGDISFVPPLANYERAGYRIGAEFPNLRAWWKQMKARPSFAASWPPE
ncbi:MAG TPA: glutathione S-transferase family protein [Candidatus Binataceae bacterium]|jgi:glutathione S-transferase|nr:glutathione S-transferase family protein [Candidatus Binataceae bacterium]